MKKRGVQGISDSRKAEEGYSLIEVIVAMLVLAVVIFSVGDLFILPVRVNNNSRVKTSATTIAMEKIEELKKKEYSELTPGGGLDQDNPVEDYHEINGANFITLWLIEENNPVTDLKKVTVKTAMRTEIGSRMGRTGVTLSTYVMNNEE